MFVLLLVIASSTALPTPGQQSEQPQVQESISHFYRQPPSSGYQEDDSQVNFPVQTIQKFTDSDGNVKVVTSYSNRNDNPAPIYKSQQIGQFDVPQNQGVRVVVPEARSKLVETEERNAPRQEQMLRKKTIRFPNDQGQYVENEEKSAFADGNSRSFSKVSSYDNSYKPKAVANRGSVYENREDNTPRIYKPIHVPDSRPVVADRVSLPIRGSKNADHALAAQGSSYVSDIEEAIDDDDDDDEDDYDDEHLHGYEEHPHIDPHGGVGLVPISHGPEVIPIGHGHQLIPISHGPEVIPIGHGPEVISIGHGPQIIPVHGGHGVGVIGVSGAPRGFSHNYSKKDAQGYNNGEQYAKGNKGSKGHKSDETYDKGHVEKHGHEHNTGGKKEEVGEKKGHLDEHNSYHKGHEHHQGAKSKEKADSKGHKKGHKTSGFRTVHHKDEYKKDEVFYDEEHDAGHEKVKAHEEGGHKEAKGGDSKKGHLSSGYKDAHKGVEGEKKEGHTYDSSKGHALHSGHEASEGHKEGFQKGGGQKGEEAHGHIHKGKGHGGW